MARPVGKWVAAKKNPKLGTRLGLFAGYYFNVRLLSWPARGFEGVGMASNLAVGPMR